MAMLNNQRVHLLRKLQTVLFTCLKFVASSTWMVPGRKPLSRYTQAISRETVIRWDPRATGFTGCKLRFRWIIGQTGPELWNMPYADFDPFRGCCGKRGLHLSKMRGVEQKRAATRNSCGISDADRMWEMADICSPSYIWYCSCCYLLASWRRRTLEPRGFSDFYSLQLLPNLVVPSTLQWYFQDVNIPDIPGTPCIVLTWGCHCKAISVPDCSVLS